MFFPEGQIRVFLYGKPVDMRNSFDGLYALARHGLQQDPLNGQLFAFINRRATQMRVLYWDRSGWCLWSKRLEAGRFIRDWRALQEESPFFRMWASAAVDEMLSALHERLVVGPTS